MIAVRPILSLERRLGDRTGARPRLIGCAIYVLGAACGAPTSVDTPHRPVGPVGGFDNAATAATGGTAAQGGSGDNPTGLVGQSGTGVGPGNTPPALGCKGLQCQQHTCASGATTISGRVYDPAAKNPLYNIAVYIPNDTVEEIKLGASCAPCDALYTGKPVASALTDADGRFTINDAPDGTNIPLVVQIGKWRKKYMIPSVALCKDTAMPDKMLTLPRNQMEGDIPNIAISTGAADTLECLLRRIGIDASEYVGGPAGTGRIHIFQGSPGRGGGGGGGMNTAPNTAPAAPLSSAALWTSGTELMKYDIVLLSCEGQETVNMNQQALHDYASAGGRVFASHFHYSWFNTGPYGMENLATWTTGSNDMGNIGATIITTFPKGKALAQWLQTTNALTNGELPISQARHNADVSAANTPSQPWIVANQSANPRGATEYFSFNTPTTAGQTPDGPGYCGRVVYSDLHVGAASRDDVNMPVPASCANGDLSPQEKALEFMLFDLSSCVIPDDKPPLPPPILN